MKNLISQTDTLIEDANKKLEAKEKALASQVSEAERVIRQSETLKKTLEANATERACELVKDKEKELEREFKAKTLKYYGYLTLMTSFGILVTVLTGVRNKVIVSDFKSFFGAIWTFLCMSFQSVFKVAKWTSGLGDMIPQNIVAFVVHWLLYLLVVVLAFGGVALGIYLFIKKFFPFFQEELADNLTLTVVLVSFALVVFFGTALKSIIPIKINLILLPLVIIASYSFLRVYTKPKY